MEDVLDVQLMPLPGGYARGFKTRSAAWERMQSVDLSHVGRSLSYESQRGRNPCYEIQGIRIDVG